MTSYNLLPRANISVILNPLYYLIWYVEIHKYVHAASEYQSQTQFKIPLTLVLLGSFVYWANPYSAGIDFRRQNLTSVDVRF